MGEKMGEVTADTREESKKGPSSGKRKKAGLVLLVVGLMATILIVFFWTRSKTHITTDNAFVEARVFAISSRIPGTVAAIEVDDNQKVQRGDLLLTLDPSDYRTQVINSSALLEMAKNETSADYAKIEESRAGITLAKTKADQAAVDLRRGEALLQKDVISHDQFDRLVTAHKAALAVLKEAEEQLRRNEATVGISGTGKKDARIAQRKALLEQAELNLSYTRIVAPADGYITRKSVEPGNNISAGQPLMAIVALDEPWVVANYKESQLSHVRPGQDVIFELDAYPGRQFRGKVDSIMAGTGAAFSLLPPENATGNYVKVVQRIPVKIIIDKSSDPEHFLRVGMSVVPTILVERSIGSIFSDINPF
jgi:membrane fusion protein (multidrug efflux system)